MTESRRNNLAFTTHITSFIKMIKRFGFKKPKNNRRFQQLFLREKIGILKASRYLVSAKEKRQPFRLFLISLLLIIILGGVCYFLFFSRVFEIKQVIINHEKKSTQIIQNQRIEDLARKILKEKRMMIFPQKIIFFFNQKLLKRILANNGWVESVDIRKVLPSQLKINLKEYEIVASLVIPGLNPGHFYLNSKAGLMNSACAASLLDNSYPVVKGILCDTLTIQNSAASVFSPNQGAIDKPLIYDRSKLNIFDQKWISMIESILQIWQSPVIKNHQLKVNFVEINEKDGLPQIKAQTNEGWLIYLLPENIDQQLANLDLILKEKLKERLGLQYIDLRFGQKIFYR